MLETYWIICYPRGDRTMLDVAEISRGCEYEESDYAVASRRRFDTEAEAVEYCAELAKKHGLKTGGFLD